MQETPTKKPKPRNPDHGPRTRSSETQRILEWIDETFEVVVYPSGFEDCIVGVGERHGGPPVAVMDVEKMLTKMEKQGMTREQAIEYFDRQLLGVHIGEENPVYMHVPNFKVKTKNSSRKGKEKK